ncbi:MAG: Adenosylcobinamide amidohydrolase [Methanoregulaceae archaeon PtaB.Bin056]|jgi:adenosylcobinamide hydrolase|nr:MAG: Adenosylcobinamide amidohydrolase [Methanoregulaceae archaeon PtaB.Bin056]
MDYDYSDSTLVIRGKFLAVSTGVDGDLRRVDALFNHTVPRDWHDTSPTLFLSDIARLEGICGDYFGLLTAVPMSALLICRSGFLTVFITAGISNHTINIIAVSTEGMSKNALLESVATISSAKTQALLETGRGIVATPTDAVIMACEGEEIHQYTGIVTAVGSRLAECVRRGVPIALSLYENNSDTPVVLDVEASRT